MNRGRRDVLKRGLATASLFLPLPYASVLAQSEGAMKLVRARKVALVLGNSKYKSVAALRNAANDAQAIADVLQELGFDVTLKLDGSRDQIEAAIKGHSLRLAQGKAVGLFYYAGHGLQLSWTNFLVPVDAAIREPEQVRAACIDLSELMDGARKAANPMNIIILDACRDNPFERDFRISNRGLTQMDAPNDTLLAYATAPGNVASDGEGTNGLYTESLIKEIRTPETRIEDVFKRVRLNVRRKTSGAQVPWESTSLEEDFWFLPPRHLTQVVEERKFSEELERWESIKNSRNPEDFYAFLLERPSGYIAEQAQFRLDQLERPVVQAQPGANGIKPLASGTNRYALGDVFEWEIIDRNTNVAQRSVSRVTYADNERVEFNGGTAIHDQMGGILHNRFGTKKPAALVEPAELALGKRWHTAYTATWPGGSANNFYDFHVIELVDVTVPAGTFKAYRVEGVGKSRNLDGTEADLRQMRWIDPTTMISVRADLDFRLTRARSSFEYSSTRLVSVLRAPR